MTALQNIGLLGKLPKDIITLILGYSSPKTLFNLLLTTKSFSSLIKNNEVYNLQLERLKTRAKIERKRINIGEDYDFYSSYDDKFANDDCITSKREGDVVDGFIGGDIKETRFSNVEDQFKHEHLDRGRRCPHCLNKNVHTERGVVATLSNGKKKYFHRACVQPYFTKSLGVIIPHIILDKPFSFLADLHGYPGTYNVYTTFSGDVVVKKEELEKSSEDEKKEENGEDADDWETDLENDDKEKEKAETAVLNQKKREDNVASLFKKLSSFLYDVKLEISVPFASSSCSSSSSYSSSSPPSVITHIQMRQRSDTTRLGEVPLYTLPELISLSLREFAVQETIRICACVPRPLPTSFPSTAAASKMLASVSLLTVSVFRDEVHYHVEARNELFVRDIIKRMEELWNTCLIARVIPDVLSSSSSSSSSSAKNPAITAPYKFPPRAIEFPTKK